MNSIFISYRRTGSSGYGGRLGDDLSEHFGRERVFRDIDSIRPGSDFAQVIDEAIAGSGIVLALIGRSWFNALNRRRLADPDDFVRLEIESALNQGIVVLPVLIEEAKLPPASRLPASISRLARTQAIELSEERWVYDLGRLISVIEAVVGVPPGPDLARTSGGPGPTTASISSDGLAGSAGRHPRLVLVDQCGEPLGADAHPIVSARPGERLDTRARVGGCGQLVEGARLQVQGCPAEWLVLEPAVDGQSEAQALMVVFAPPKSATTKPGVYRVELAAHDGRGPDMRSDRVRLGLRVREFASPVATVVTGPPGERTCRTRLLRASDASFAIAVHNGGNGSLEARLSVEADDLVTRVWPASLSVAAGEEARARVRATPIRRWLGAASARPVTVAVAWDTGDEATTLTVPLTHRPLLSVRQKAAPTVSGTSSQQSTPSSQGDS